MNWLDLFGACLSLTCTYYFTTLKRAAWAIGALAIILNSILYYQKGIYGSLFLEAVYFISMIWGWYEWGKKRNADARPVIFLKSRHILFLSVLAVLGIAFVSFLLKAFTDSDVPYLDATITVLSLIAQGLLCIKVIHCWIVWFVVDALVAGLHIYKGIPFHSALHWLYLIFAVVGFCRWYQIYQKQDNQFTFSSGGTPLHPA
jgi:nicotinamide mononucleotide transporter